MGVYHVGSKWDAVGAEHVQPPDPSPHHQQPPPPLLKRVNQSKTMPRATSPESESESERVPSKKQKKREEKEPEPVDDPMDEDTEEYEIEKVMDSSREVFVDVRSFRRPWLRVGDLNIFTGRNGVLREVERLS